MRTAIFSQIGLDSGALGLLGSLVHAFDEPGHYVGTALAGEEPRGEFEIVVADDSPPSTQIDLSSLAGSRRDPCCKPGQPAFRVAPTGRVVFHVGGGHERWGVLVGEPNSREAEFDSRGLREGDLFAATILRPGTYKVRNTHGSGSTDLVVRYVRPGKEKYTPPDPISIGMGIQASRKALRVGPGQGIIFEATERARIVVELVEPDDGPAGDR